MIMMLKVLMIVNEGFQVDEYFKPREIFEQAHIQVVTASRYGGVVNPGRKYMGQYPSVKADLSFDEVNVSDYAAITFTGGAGAWSDYFPNRRLHGILLEATQNPKMIVGLICAGVGLLATAQNLDGTTPMFKGRHVTGYGEVAGMLIKLGELNYDSGDLSEPYVVQDKNLITARDPMSSELFAQTILSRLQ